MITAGCHSEHNKSKARVSLFSSGMIVKPERNKRTAKQKDLTQNPTKERGVPGVLGAGQKGSLVSGAFGALAIISGELESNHILLEI